MNDGYSKVKKSTILWVVHRSGRTQPRQKFSVQTNNVTIERHFSINYKSEVRMSQ